MSPGSAPGKAVPAGRRPHVLVVTPYYWPIVCAATHLMKDLAEGLAEGGYQVTVLSNRPAAEAGPGPWDSFPGRIHRTWNPFLRRMGALAKMGEYLWFLAFFFFRGLAVPRVDLLFVVSNPPLAGLPGALLARLKGAKLVYNLQDIFPDSAVVAGMLPASGWLCRMLRKAERASYRVSDLVATISPSFSSYVQQAAPGTPVATIPNWVDTEQVRPMARSEDPAIEEYRRGGDFVVQYAGNMGFVQNLETVLRAAERLKGEAGIRFVFIGDGNAKRGLEDQVRARGMANCNFLPMQPLARVPLVYNACDLGVIPLKPGAAEIAVPSKTWNYLAAGRPVLCCVEEDSSLARVIQDSRSGSVLPPEDSEGLARAILAYRDAPERVQAEGARGRAYVEAHLSRRTALQSYLRVMDDLVGRAAAGDGPGAVR